MLEELRERVCNANQELKHHGLVFQTWGNASARCFERQLVVIKPSGIDYEMMRPEHMVLTDMSGKVMGGDLKPSVDLEIHLAMYRAWDTVQGVVHSHSHYATCFAQARRTIPCFGTTHADYFHGPVPLIRAPDPDETVQAYEYHTGRRIVESFSGMDPLCCPGALVAGHGPFAWGITVEKAVENALVLEELARMAFHTLCLDPEAIPLETYLLDKHYLRKHGSDAYYGQDGK